MPNAKGKAFPSAEFKEVASNVQPRAAHTARPGADRAKQFMPFAALKGYCAMVQKQEQTVSPRKELSEEEIMRISQVLFRVGKGDMVQVVHYAKGAYRTMQGMVSRIVPEFHTLRVVKTEIAFEDILDIELLDD